MDMISCGVLFCLSEDGGLEMECPSTSESSDRGTCCLQMLTRDLFLFMIKHPPLDFIRGVIPRLSLLIPMEVGSIIDTRTGPKPQLLPTSYSYRVVHPGKEFRYCTKVHVEWRNVVGCRCRDRTENFQTH